MELVKRDYKVDDMLLRCLLYTSTRMAQEKNLPVEAKMFNHGGRRKTVKK